MPELAILCDPSHISGTQQYIASIAHEALEAGLDGLMIESHWRPELALSDPGQQLSPAQLGELLNQVISKRTHVRIGKSHELDNLWREIEEIDQDMSALAKKRAAILDQIKRSPATCKPHLAGANEIARA